MNIIIAAGSTFFLVVNKLFSDKKKMSNKEI